MSAKTNYETAFVKFGFLGAVCGSVLKTIHPLDTYVYDLHSYV